MRGLLFTVCVFAASSAFAKVWLPKVFSDNMMLQGNEPVKIWGTAEKDADVKIEFQDKSASVKADSEGNWSLKFPALNYATEGKEIKIFENGKESKIIKNVIVGEVWIAGGQSNMAFRINQEAHAKEAKEAFNTPLIRVFTQPVGAASDKVQKDLFGGRWQGARPNLIGDFSAVGLYFAKGLHDNLNVPIGIIETPRGGASMGGYLKREDMSGIKSFEESLAKFDRENANYNYQEALENYQKKLAEYKQQIADGSDPKTLKKPNNPPFAKGEQMYMPCVYYNAKIAPIAGFTARGVIWYQGETDAKFYPLDFDEQFERLITCWRKYFEKPEMPFVFMQLPSMDRDWVSTRANQEKVANKMKNVGMVVTLDTGDEKDVHPTDKTIVSSRMANVALRNVYGKKDLPDFPRIDDSKFAQNKVVIKFKKSKDALEVKGEPRGFEVFVNSEWIAPDKVSLKKDVLTLESSNGNIEKARYLNKGWALPEVCIYNKAGLPLAPFLIEK